MSSSAEEMNSTVSKPLLAFRAAFIRSSRSAGIGAPVL